MIEDIKWLVSEHKTLIIVIFMVLFFWFIYRLLYCKVIPIKKIKGGEVCEKIIEVLYEDSYYNKIVKYKVKFALIGMKIKDIFYILSQQGENKMKNDKIFELFFHPLHEIVFSNDLNGKSIKKIVENPISMFSKDGDIANLISNSNDSLRRLIFTNSLYKPNISNAKCTYNFSKCLNSLKNTKLKDDILKYYNKMNDFLFNNAGDLITNATFIGQPGEIGSATFVEGENTRRNHLTTIKACDIKGELQTQLKGQCWSNSSTREFELVGDSIYNEFKEKIRNWYDGNNLVQNTLNRCYSTNKYCIIEKKINEEKIEGTKWHYADIYPAHKVILMLMLMVKLYSNFCANNAGNPNNANEYKKMISSYLINVHLFNTFCGVRMESGWNESVKNLYVYNFANLSNEPMNMTQLSLNMSAEEGLLVGKRFEKIINTFPGFENPLFSNFGSSIRIDNKRILNEKLRRQIKNEMDLLINENIKNDKDVVRNCFTLISIMHDDSGGFRNYDLLNYFDINTTRQDVLDKLKCLDWIIKHDNVMVIEDFPLNFNDKNVFEEIGSFYQKFISFIDENDNYEENYQNLILNINEIILKNNTFDIILLIINDISLNHIRNDFFWSKIEKILIQFKEAIINSFDEVEIFNFFKNNKKLLAFLIENGLLKDAYINYWISKQEDLFNKYFKEDKSIKNFESKQKMGENDNEVCELIRNDNLNDFITYTEKNIIPFNSIIPSSIFETNEMLIYNKSVNLIEYAAFFGSFKIFNYLVINDVKLKHSIWFYAIHGNNPEIIQKIESLNIQPLKIKKCLEIAIKCHHSEIYDYINNKYNKDNTNNPVSADIFFLIYHNFSKIPEKISINYNIFLIILCDCDYFLYLEEFLKTKNFKIRSFKTLLNIALYFGNKNIIKFIINSKQNDLYDNKLSIESKLKNIQETINELDENEKTINELNEMESYNYEQQSIYFEEAYEKYGNAKNNLDKAENTLHDINLCLNEAKKTSWNKMNQKEKLDKKAEFEKAKANFDKANTDFEKAKNELKEAYRNKENALNTLIERRNELDEIHENKENAVKTKETLLQKKSTIKSLMKTNNDIVYYTFDDIYFNSHDIWFDKDLY